MDRPAAAKIAKNLVKSVSTGQYCRLSARELSSLKPQLDAHNVRMIGIGLEELGVEEFVAGNYFSGELYIDTKKQCYQDLGYKRFNFFSVIASLFAKVARSRYAESSKLGGNLKGDGLQNGGTLIFDKGGKCLLNYAQDNPADHVELSEVLKALNITAAVNPTPPATQPEQTCAAGACGEDTKTTFGTPAPKCTDNECK